MTEELTAGDHVTATVRLLRPLAQGGMGTVWIAEHLVLDTEVVVKLMGKHMEAAAGAAARFAREAAVAAAVKSPHVVQVFDSGVTDNGVAFIVMELLDGHDLGAHLTANGRMAPEEVALVVGQLGKALAKAHRVGVIHRDLKPDNIFLCELDGGERFVKLLDFGAAKDDSRTPSSTTLGQLIGTPYYMSPEQILGEHIDPRTDIWSLGVVAYEALTGVRPFEGVTVGAITLAIHTTNPRLTTLVPELPDTVDEWFARACARDPAERFSTMRAATDGFIRAIAGDPALPDSGPGSADDLSGIPSSTTSAGLVAVAPAPEVPRLASTTTSLSSTLSSPRHKERRTMMWLAGLVAAAALLAMVALLTANSSDRKTTAALTGADPSPRIASAPTQAASGGLAMGGSAGVTSAGATSAGATRAAGDDASTTSAGQRTPAALTATAGTAAPATIPAKPLAGSQPPALPSLAPPPRLGAPAVSGAAPFASSTPAASSAAPAPPAPALPKTTPEPPEAPTAPLDLRDLAPPTPNSGP